MVAEKTISDLVRRIEKLERAVFSGDKKQNPKKADFKGATGGLRLLVSNGFCDRRRLFSDIEAELAKLGYHYGKQAIQTPLNRLSNSTGALVSIRSKGRKTYAKRK